MLTTIDSERIHTYILGTNVPISAPFVGSGTVNVDAAGFENRQQQGHRTLRYALNGEFAIFGSALNSQTREKIAWGISDYDSTASKTPRGTGENSAFHLDLREFLLTTAMCVSVLSS